MGHGGREREIASGACLRLLGVLVHTPVVLAPVDVQAADGVALYPAAEQPYRWNPLEGPILVLSLGPVQLVQIGKNHGVGEEPLQKGLLEVDVLAAEEVVDVQSTSAFRL